MQTRERRQHTRIQYINSCQLTDVVLVVTGKPHGDPSWMLMTCANNLRLGDDPSMSRCFPHNAELVKVQLWSSL